MRNKNLFICLLPLLLLFAAPSTYSMLQEKQDAQPETKIIMLKYEDFGPQSMAYKLIGYEWNQWKSEGHDLPDDVEVRIVIYRNMPLSDVKKKYPVVKGKSDYRYVEYSKAIGFLRNNIKEIEEYKKVNSVGNSEHIWDKLLSTLKNTKEKIIQSLGT